MERRTPGDIPEKKQKRFLGGLLGRRGAATEPVIDIPQEKQRKPEKSRKELLTERCAPLSVIPPQEEWGTVRILKDGEMRDVTIPFVSSEVAAIEEGYDANMRLWGKGVQNSGPEREYYTEGQFFPSLALEESSFPGLPTVHDRVRAVRGILIAADAATEIFFRHPEGTGFAPRGESLKDLRLIQALPEKLIAHQPQGDQEPNS